jgi:hypothetical protein
MRRFGDLNCGSRFEEARGRMDMLSWNVLVLEFESGTVGYV